MDTALGQPLVVPGNVDCPGLFYVDDQPVDGVREAFRRATAARGVPMYELHSGEVRWSALAPLPAGSLLYTRSISARALRLESWLWAPDVATIYPLGPHRTHVGQTPGFALAGIPIPRTLPVLSSAREDLDAAVVAVGGFPCVLRFSGHSGGRGIVRVDTRAGLVSAVDHALARGALPELVEYVVGTPWRVAVVGGRAVGATRGVVPDGDFRNRESTQPDDYTADVPPLLAEPAIAATAAVLADAAGVDLLVTDEQRVVVLEANTPFYFGHLEAHGIDVAGPIVGMLLTRAAGRSR